MGNSSISSEKNEEFDNLCETHAATFRALKLDYKDLRGLFNVFCAMDPERKGAVSIWQMLHYCDLERTPFSERMVNCLPLNNKALIDYKEFVVAVWNYCTLTREALITFAFDLYDTYHEGCIQANVMELMLSEVYGPNFQANVNARSVISEIQAWASHTALSRQASRQQEHSDSDEGNDTMAGFTLKDFKAFVAHYASMLRPAFSLQMAMRAHIMNDDFWKRCTQHRENMEMHSGYQPLQALVAQQMQLDRFRNVVDGEKQADGTSAQQHMPLMRMLRLELNKIFHERNAQKAAKTTREHILELQTNAQYQMHVGSRADRVRAQDKLQVVENGVRTVAKAKQKLEKVRKSIERRQQAPPGQATVVEPAAPAPAPALASQAGQGATAGEAEIQDFSYDPDIEDENSASFVGSSHATGHRRHAQHGPSLGAHMRSGTSASGGGGNSVPGGGAAHDGPSGKRKRPDQETAGPRSNLPIHADVRPRPGRPPPKAAAPPPISDLEIADMSDSDSDLSDSSHQLPFMRRRRRSSDSTQKAARKTDRRASNLAPNASTPAPKAPPSGESYTQKQLIGPNNAYRIGGGRRDSALVSGRRESLTAPPKGQAASGQGSGGYAAPSPQRGMGVVPSHHRRESAAGRRDSALDSGESKTVRRVGSITAATSTDPRPIELRTTSERWPGAPHGLSGSGHSSLHGGGAVVRAGGGTMVVGARYSTIPAKDASAARLGTQQELPLPGRAAAMGALGQGAAAPPVAGQRFPARVVTVATGRKTSTQMR